jgi:hypothetical protein
MTAARAVWTLAHGDPGDQHVLHRCNEGDGSHGCINVRHLYLGDNDDNTQDRLGAERQARGEGHAMHVLTEAQVLAARRRHVPGRAGNTRALAEEFGVAVTTMRNAVSRRSRRHLGGAAWRRWRRLNSRSRLSCAQGTPRPSARCGIASRRSTPASAPAAPCATTGTPTGWARDVIDWGQDGGLTGYQAGILDALPARKRVAVRGPHGLGKTGLAAITILWFATTREAAAVDWKVICTASAWRHLQVFLFPEVHK